MRRSDKPGHVTPTSHAEMVRRTAARSGVPKKTVAKVMTAYMQAVQDELTSVHPVTMFGVGTLTPPKCMRYNKAERAVCPTRRFTFRPSIGTRNSFVELNGVYGARPQEYLVPLLRKHAVGRAVQARVKKVARRQAMNLVRKGADAFEALGENHVG